MENKPERKDTRFERRLKEKKQEKLNKLVSIFLERRSSVKDPDGIDAAKLYDEIKDEWMKECVNHNRLVRVPFKLRYTAFEESVNHFLEEELAERKKVYEEKQVKDFEHWYKRLRPWRTRPLNSLYFWFTSKGNHEKQLQLWKNYYIQVIMAKND
jgi:hypothetical protein